jgi:hypothetical protein
MVEPGVFERTVNTRYCCRTRPASCLLSVQLPPSVCRPAVSIDPQCCSCPLTNCTIAAEIPLAAVRCRHCLLIMRRTDDRQGLIPGPLSAGCRHSPVHSAATQDRHVQPSTAKYSHVHCKMQCRTVASSWLSAVTARTDANAGQSVTCGSLGFES